MAKEHPLFASVEWLHAAPRPDPRLERHVYGDGAQQLGGRRQVIDGAPERGLFDTEYQPDNGCARCRGYALVLDETVALRNAAARRVYGEDGRLLAEVRDEAREAYRSRAAHEA